MASNIYKKKKTLCCKLQLVSFVQLNITTSYVQVSDANAPSHVPFYSKAWLNAKLAEPFYFSHHESISLFIICSINSMQFLSHHSCHFNKCICMQTESENGYSSCHTHAIFIYIRAYIRMK